MAKRTVAARMSSAVYDALARSKLLRDVERAFRDATGLSLKLVPADEPQMFFIQDACLTGFKMILDMAFDGAGNLYVLQHATGAVQG